MAIIRLTMSTLKRTPLYGLQAEAGARFVEFAGWELPVQFAGVKAEHHAVRQQVGMFDVSHMGEVRIRGPQAAAAVQRMITQDAERLHAGRALYTVMCQPDGGIVDDFIVYRESHESYFICVNAARRDRDVEHMQKAAADFDCSVEDISEHWAQIAVQGPRAITLVEALTDIDVAGLRPFRFSDGVVADVADVRVARTGYTGEDGVELYVASGRAPELWRALQNQGEAHGLVPCGLAARDTLRLEAGLLLYGNDIDEAHNPIEAGIGWVVKLDAGEFIGREALRRVKEVGPERKLVGLKMRARGIPRAGYRVVRSGEEIGVVTSGTHSPTLGEPIGLAYVPADCAAVGTSIDILIRGKAVAAEVVPTPFYKREA